MKYKIFHFVGKVKHLFQISTYFTFLLFLSLFAANLAQTVNKGLWYHQQPTSINDSGSFFGEKETFEGFCGLAASEMALQYFIPNIQAQLYNMYGPADFHDDGRGGLKPSDPPCYSPYYTYTFQDFLGHRYINRHITKTGCSYREIEGLFESIDADIPGYTLDFAWVNGKQIGDYLDKGYLIIMNTNQGGGHYILIGGWEGDTCKPESCSYYIWDSWKYPLDLDSTQFTHISGIAGNSLNKGNAQLINTYKLFPEGFNKIFKDQMGDGTMPAVKFIPAVSASGIESIKSKAFLITADYLYNIDINSFIDTISIHNISDIFIPLKNSSNIFSTELLLKLISPAHQKKIKVHALVNPDDFNVSTTTRKYKALKGNITPQGSYIENLIQQILDPLCRINPDGICFENIGSTGRNKSTVKFFTAIRRYIDSCTSSNILIGAMVNITSGYAGKDEKLKFNLPADKLNYIIPLLYTHDNFDDPAWVGTNTLVLKKSLKGKCEVWPAIQTLDNTGNYMASPEMKQCIDNAAMNGATGVVLSHYPAAEWQWEVLDSTR